MILYKVTETVSHSDDKEVHSFFSVGSAVEFIIKNYCGEKQMTCSIYESAPLHVALSCFDEDCGEFVTVDLACVNEYEEERYVRVTDDWYPCYDGNKISLSIKVGRSDLRGFVDYYVGISAWGADDTGMHLTCHDLDFHDSMRMYNLWKERIYDKVPEGCNKEWFLDHGFDFC